MIKKWRLSRGTAAAHQPVLDQACCLTWPVHAIQVAGSYTFTIHTTLLVGWIHSIASFCSQRPLSRLRHRQGNKNGSNRNYLWQRHVVSPDTFVDGTGNEHRERGRASRETSLSVDGSLARDPIHDERQEWPLSDEIRRYVFTRLTCNDGAVAPPINRPI